jgi:predicted aldo/keto reductase-like oxidoreductase
MRLPLLKKDEQTAVDLETLNRLVDAFLEKGFTYFDTALTYHGFKSEEPVREVLVARKHSMPISYMADFKPLSDGEYRVIDKVTEIINATPVIPCTACQCCVAGYPKKIAIPDYFALYNSEKRAVTDNISSQLVYYLNLSSTHGKAGDCIGCKACERACLQHLKIAEFMKDLSATFDKGPGLPTR